MEDRQRGMKFHYDPVTVTVFTAARQMALVFLYVPVVDTEMTEYPYIIFVLFENIWFCLSCELGSYVAFLHQWITVYLMTALSANGVCHVTFIRSSAMWLEVNDVVEDYPQITLIAIKDTKTLIVLKWNIL